MKPIDLYDRDGAKLATVYLIPTGREIADLVTWQGRYFVRCVEGYAEVFAWPAFSADDVEFAKAEGLLA